MVIEANIQVLGKLTDNSFYQMVKRFENMGFFIDDCGAFILKTDKNIGYIMAMAENIIEDTAVAAVPQTVIEVTLYWGKNIDVNSDPALPAYNAMMGFFKVR